MKSFTHISRLLIFSIFTLFLLVACERPTPRVDEIDVTEVPPADATAAPIVQPTPEPVPTEAYPVGEEATDEVTTEGETPAEGEEAPATEETEAPAEEPAVLPEDGIHVVKAGDTLSNLALVYGVTVEEIAAANGFTDVDTLEVGQEIKIPEPGSVVVEPEEPAEPAEPETPITEEIVHVVQPGENLFRIGLQYGYTVDELADYNGIENPDRLDVGQTVRIPPQP